MSSESNPSLAITCAECHFVFEPRSVKAPDLYYSTPCPRCGRISADDQAVAQIIPAAQKPIPLNDTLFQFMAAFEIVRGDFPVDPSLLDVAIQSAAKAFTRNIERVCGIMILLPYSIGYSIRNYHIDYEIKRTKKSEDEIEASLDAKYDAQYRLFYIGRHALDAAIAAAEERPKHAVEGLLSSLIIGAWTAFEALTEDVWIQCLNARPRLGFNALNAEPASTDPEEVIEEKNNRKIPIPAELLRKPGFNASERMGDILTIMEKWEFSKKIHASKAYAAAFGEDGKQFVHIIQDEKLKWLNDLRNNLVHNAGIADKKFTQLIKSHPTLGAIVVGEEIPMSGDLAAEFVAIAKTSGNALLNAANAWLSAHPS